MLNTVVCVKQICLVIALFSVPSEGVPPSRIKIYKGRNADEHRYILDRNYELRKGCIKCELKKHELSFQ